MSKDEFIQLVINGLERVIFEGSSNFATFILSTDPYYIQIAANRGDFRVLCEAAGNGYMLEKDHISNEQIQQLIQVGWPEAIGESNHSMYLSCESIADRTKLAELFYETAAIYGSNEISEVNIEIQ